MMLELMQQRRSIRKYMDKKIEVEKVELLKKAALLAPTSKNKQGWEFIFIEDKTMLNELSKTKNSGSQMLKDAAMAVVIAMKTDDNNVWIEDGSVAATHIYLMSEYLGLGSCWVQFRNRFKDAEGEIKSNDCVRELLGIPKELEILCAISIGYKGEEKQEIVDERLKYNKIHMETYID